MYHYADAIEALTDQFGNDHVLTHDGVHRTWRQFEDRAARLGQALADADRSPAPRSACCSTTAPSTTRPSSRH